MDKVIGTALWSLLFLGVIISVGATLLANENTDQAAALTATLHLANHQEVVLDAQSVITMCISISDLNTFSRVAKPFEGCDKDEETVMFPVHYHPNGSKTIGQPHVGNDIEWYEVAAK